MIWLNVLFVITYLSSTLTITSGNDENLPNILYILADDLGWGMVGYHNKVNQEIRTPNIDDLVANGLQLNRHYVYSGCSPTRASMQSGRLPVHVTTNNGDGLDDGTHGIPPQMTGIATKLGEAGYSTHLVGKWDCGFSSYEKMPLAKGYDSFYGYLSKSIMYFTKAGDNDCGGVDFVDLWENDGPAADSLEDLDRTDYVEFEFKERVLELIEDQDESSPFFIVYSMHLPHYPVQIPEQYYQQYDFDENLCRIENSYIYEDFTDGTFFKCRSATQSQVNLMDTIIGEIVDKLKEQGLYENTLIVFSTDNGGSYELDATGGNNWPLRGAKSSALEGGVRGTAFVSGGYLPKSRHGQIENGMMHIADWYTTFCELAGVDSYDIEAEKAGLPVVDGLNMWPLISGEVDVSPRNEIPIESGVLIVGDYKYFSKDQRWAVWGGQIFPNSTTPQQDVLEYTKLDCAGKGCLFDVVNDISETKNLIDELPDLAAAMKQRLLDLEAEFFENEEQGIDSCPEEVDLKDMTCGCWMAINNYHFFSGPYQDLSEDQIYYDKVDDDLILSKNDIEYMTNMQSNDNYMVYIGFGVCIIGLMLVVVFIKYFKAMSGKQAINDQTYQQYNTI